MKLKKRVLSFLLAMILTLVYMLPTAAVLNAKSLSDYTTVASFNNNSFPVIESSSQGVSFTTGTDYLTVTTTNTNDPYFTVDLPDTSLSGKVIAIKYKVDLLCSIANAWLYPDSSAGGWVSAGLLDTSKLSCDGFWNLTTFTVSEELVGSDGKNAATDAQKKATIKSLRIGGTTVANKKLQVAFVGVFDSTAQAKEYNDLYCATHTTVDRGRIDIIPSAKTSVSTESYDFQDSAVTNGLSAHNNKTAFNNSWTINPGTGASKYVVNGSNKYLYLRYDSIKHDWFYSNDSSYVFSADVMPEKMSGHFAGFIFNHGYENTWETNDFFETNNVEGNNSVSRSGITVNIHPSIIEICVLEYNESTASISQIKYTYVLKTAIDSAFHNFKAVDDANGLMRFFIDGEMFAYIKYDDPGLLPGSAEQYNERYYRNARIYNAEGELQVSTSSALISYVKSVAIGSRARGLSLDNIKIAATGSVIPSLSLDKTNVSESENINATISYGESVVKNLSLGIYNENEECGSGIGKATPTVKIELDGKGYVTLPKLMAGNYYAVLMSGNTQTGSKVSFTVSDVKQNESIYISDAQTQIGSVIKVPVVLANNPGIKNLSIKVIWDSTALKPVSASNGTVMTGATFSASNTKSTYTLSWTGNTNSTATGNIAFLEFEVSSMAPLGENVLEIDVISATSTGGDITKSVTAGKGSIKVKDTVLKINGASLSISNDISIHYYVKKAEFDNNGYQNPYIIAEFEGQEVKLLPQTITVNGELRYSFSFEHIIPARMNSLIFTTLCATKSGVEYKSKAISYSISQYAYSMLEKTSDSSLKTLLVDMLNYGAEAQKYDLIAVNDLANAKLTSEQKSWGTQSLRKLNSVLSLSDVSDNDKVIWKGMGLYLRNRVAFRGSFTTESTKGLQVKITDSNGNLIKTINENEFEYDGEKVIFYYSDLYAFQMSEAIHFSVCDSTGKAISGTCTYSIESYISRMCENSATDADLKSICVAIIKYGDSASKYVKGQNNTPSQMTPVDIGSRFYANIHTNSKYLTLAGTNVVLGTPNGSMSEIWKFTRLDNGAYSIINAATGNALDVTEAKSENFTNVQTYKNNGTAAQQWWIYLYNGSYIFRPAHTETHVLDVYAGNFSSGTNIDIYQINYTASQLFSIENRLDENTGKAGSALDKSKTYRILFIGNSFTDTNKMSATIFPPIVSSAGYAAEIHSITRGSWTLEQFANSSDSYGAQVDAHLRTYKYDYVILQEQSHRPITNAPSFYAGVRKLDAKIKANGAKTVLYATWGYRQNHPSIPGMGGSTAQMEAYLRGAYMNIGNEIGAEIAHVGKAFTHVYTNHPSIELYNTTDLYHPSQAGSTLAAYVIFATIFKYDPRLVENNGTAPNAVAAGVLKSVAYDVALGSLSN